MKKWSLCLLVLLIFPRPVLAQLDTLKVVVSQPDSVSFVLAQAETLQAVLVTKGFWDPAVIIPFVISLSSLLIAWPALRTAGRQAAANEAQARASEAQARASEAQAATAEYQASLSAEQLRLIIQEDIRVELVDDMAAGDSRDSIGVIVHNRGRKTQIDHILLIAEGRDKEKHFDFPRREPFNDEADERYDLGFGARRPIVLLVNPISILKKSGLVGTVKLYAVVTGESDDYDSNVITLDVPEDYVKSY